VFLTIKGDEFRMFLMADKKRVQVPMDKDARNRLIDLAGDMSKAGDKEVALGALAGTLLAKLLKEHPELVDQMLGIESAAVPKKASGKR
jgi:hypothetical protein